MVSSVKTGTKRRATAQGGGTKAKKAHIEPSNTKTSEKKRRQPITRPVVQDEEEDEDENGSDAWSEEDAGGQDDAMAVDEEQPALDGDSSSAPKKDPNASRESHKAQKALQEQRKAAKPHSALLFDAKAVWSLARQKTKITSAERQKHVKDLMDIIRGKVKEIVFKHDASRIVQTVVKYGGQKERDEVAEELKGSYKELAQSKYSKFLVTKLIRFCPAHRTSILLEFQSHVIRLLLHREASGVLADAFELHANAYERSILLREFYGKEAALFTVTRGSEQEKEAAKQGLSGLLEGADTERRRRILTAVQENLTTIFNNSDKGAVSHAIVHRALWEYLTAVNATKDDAEREKHRREMFETCQEILPEMVHTKDGSRAVRDFLAYGSAKDRKQILKVLKPHIDSMCVDDEAQLVLFTALDVLDDTKLLAKTIVSAITAIATKLYTSSQGRRSLLYLIVPRCRRHFTPAQIATLAETDAIRAQTSKKDEASRQDEVRKAASEALLQWVQTEGEKVVGEPSGCLLVAEILLSTDGDKTGAVETILKALSPDATVPGLLSRAPTNRLYKTLLQGGHFNRESNLVERVPSSLWDTTSFAQKFITIVGQQATTEMCLGEGHGTFLVAELCHALIRGDSADRTKLKKWFDDKIKKTIKGEEVKGKQVLLEKLGAL